jgi:hypothetical protein
MATYEEWTGLQNARVIPTGRARCAGVGWMLSSAATFGCATLSAQQ